ncbi:MAG: hypothetical protein IKT60_04170 [Clostridia bacterium]|nr:hypothetical protein [Clostridia bacterium]
MKKCKNNPGACAQHPEMSMPHPERPHASTLGKEQTTPRNNASRRKNESILSKTCDK